MTATILAMLQTVAALLAGAQAPNTSLAAMQRAINDAEQTLQVIAQAEAKIPFSVKKNDGIWPNIQDLANSPYLDADGNYVPLGQGVKLVEADTSFGDLNADGLDDAAVIVDKPTPSGTPNYYLAAMLNQNGILFNIADLPLGTSTNIIAHSIKDGQIILDGAHYELVGTALIKLQ